MNKNKLKSRGCGCLLFFLIIGAVLFFLTIVGLIIQLKKAPETYVDPSTSYIEETEDLARKTAKKYHLIPSIVMAQSALESNWGTSVLSREYHNYFGVKANSGEEAIQLETEEFVDGISGQYLEAFRAYKSKKDSFYHYGQLISQAPRYEKVRAAKNYREAAQALKECGYATDPNYDKKIISIVEKYEFYEMDEKSEIEQ